MVPDGWVEIAVPADKPTAGLAAQRAGLTIVRIDNVWCAPGDQGQAVQAFVDAYDPLPDVKAALLARLDAERTRRDDALLGDLLNRVASLTMGVSLIVKFTYLQQPLSAPERAAADGLIALYSRHLALLGAAQAIAADVAALATVGDALAVDVEHDGRWPA